MDEDMRPLALVIEDNLNMANACKEAVTQAGYEVHVATDGLTAIALLKNEKYAFVLLDLHLPGMNGDEILRSIRKMPHLENARVVLATADDRMANELVEEADLVFLKPVGFQQLTEIASRFLPSRPDFINS